MAITNSQQARQMYKEGDFVMQGGVKNYLGKQKTVSNVPVKWKSGSNKPATELAYITEAEKNLLLKEDIHRSLKNGPNTGPEGVMSLDSQGDMGGSEDKGTNDDGSNNPGGNARENRRSNQYGQKRTTVQKGTLSDPQEKKDYFTQSYTGPSKFGGLFGGYRDTTVPNTTAYGNKSRVGSLIMSGFGALAGIPGLGLLANLGPFNNRTFFDQKVTPAGKFTGTGYEDYMSQRMAGTIDAYGNPINQDNDNDNNVLTVQQLLAQQQAAANAAASSSNVPTTSQQPGTAYRFMADGGIADTEVARQNYFIGGIIKSATKAVKKVASKVNRARKKVLKNPYVQTALAVYAPYAIGSTGFMAGASPFMRQAAISGLTQGGLQLASGQGLDAKGILRSAAISGALGAMNPAQGAQAATTGADKAAMVDYSDMSKFNDLGLGGSGGAANIQGGIPSALEASEVALTGNTFQPQKFKSMVDAQALEKIDPKVIETISKTDPEKLSKFAELAKKIDDSKIGGALLGDGKGGISALKAIGIASALPLLGVGAPEEEDEDLYRGEGIDVAAIRANPYDYIAPRFMAEGGSAEPVAKKVMPLLDMGGQEMDLRAEGGFVPIGRMEKADDVPARLSKNEFVFTAEAVRNAGDGDIDKGAEVMYNMMKNLESGGDVSGESQGLDGAKQMFQTSQRLGEVI